MSPATSSPATRACRRTSISFRLKRHAFDLGLGISGTGVRNDFTAADKAVRAEGVQRIKAWIEVAAKLGAPTVRAFADSQPPFKNWQEASGNASREQVEEWMAADLLECAEHGEKFGVIVAVQNHGDFINTGAEHLSLLKRVDHEWCSALVDTGKYITDDPYVDIALMAPYAVNWQIKETLFSKPDAPRTDMKKLLTIIRKSGYRGYLPIETLSMKRPGYDSYVEVPKMLAELNEAIAATAIVKNNLYETSRSHYFLTASVAFGQDAPPLMTSAAKVKPSSKWEDYPTRLVAACRTTSPPPTARSPPMAASSAKNTTPPDSSMRRRPANAGG